MEKTLQAIGASGTLLVVVLVLVLGWRTVKAILEAWEKLLLKVREINIAGIDAHVREHHAGDEVWKREVRDGFVSIAKDIRAVHERIDEYLVAEAEASKRRASGL